MTVERVSFSF